LWCDGEESEGGAFGVSAEEALLDSVRGVRFVGENGFDEINEKW
jgi:hypothetical protein